MSLPLNFSTGGRFLVIILRTTLVNLQVCSLLIHWSRDPLPFFLGSSFRFLIVIISCLTAPNVRYFRFGSLSNQVPKFLKLSCASVGISAKNSIKWKKVTSWKSTSHSPWPGDRVRVEEKHLFIWLFVKMKSTACQPIVFLDQTQFPLLLRTYSQVGRGGAPVTCQFSVSPIIIRQSRFSKSIKATQNSSAFVMINFFWWLSHSYPGKYWIWLWSSSCLLVFLPSFKAV